MNIAVIVFCVILMILGVAELARLLMFWWSKPLTEGKLTLVVSPESAEECECVLRSAMERIRWLDVKGPVKVICLDRAGDREIERICRLLSLRYPCLRACKTEDLVYNLTDGK